MHLLDEAKIYVRSGKGGDGCVSLRREKYIPKGGPDGGDGGRGGSVILVADPHLDTLLPFRYAPHYFAPHGQQGSGSSRHGRDGEDRRVKIPVGTQVRDEETDEIVADLDEPGQEVVVARGGRGGYGNEHFKTATNQTPREATPGEPVVERTLLLELKLIADVGLVGLPNAGKSTLLSSISKARPKVADYPFTTLVPQPGIAELPGDRRLVVADIPGLIEGAADGAGLGHDFLKHIERTRVIVHLIDLMPMDESDPVRNHEVIRRELHAFSPELASKPEVVVLNKIDLVDPEEREAVVRRTAHAIGLGVDELVVASGATGENLREVLERAWDLVRSVD
ncbi:MAG: GTPase ObgE [Phycisphaerae bacterium]|nr:GTPase ObgE [Phycisphaerae bacterium]